MVNVKSPMYPKSNLYNKCTNIWKEIQYKLQEEIENKIREYLTISILMQGFLQTSHSRPDLSQDLKSV